MTWHSVGKNLARILLTCAIILGIGAAIVVLSPESKATRVAVDTARANIFWMTPSTPSNTQKFTAALRDLGHEPPRAYRLNDNNVYFSTRVTHKSPEMLVHEYQQAFVNSGLNSRAWLQSTEGLLSQPSTASRMTQFDERSEAAMAGEVLPASVSRNHFVMTGMLINNPADSQSEDDSLTASVEAIEKARVRLAASYTQCGGDPAALKRAQQRAKNQPLQEGSAAQKLDTALARQSSCDSGGPQYCSDLRERLNAGNAELKAIEAAINAQPGLKDCEALRKFDRDTLSMMSEQMTDRVYAFRSLEATRDPASGQTMVTASWSDEEFDMNSVLADEYPVSRNGADEIPLCDSCKRALSFDGTADEALYSTHSLWSTEPVSRVASEYISSLTRDGWDYIDGDSLARQVLARIETPEPDTGSVLRFRRDQQSMTINLRSDRNSGRTLITVGTTQ